MSKCYNFSAQKIGDKSCSVHGWGFQYVHNHAATNGASLYIAGLVLENEISRIQVENLSQSEIGQIVKMIKIAGYEICERAMKLLEHVIDGSLEEGVSYGSYTSRGFFMFLALAKRHENLDFSNHPWIIKQFNFYKSTAVKNYIWTVGFADTSYNWFYGPEAQLYFLDK